MAAELTDVLAQLEARAKEHDASRDPEENSYALGIHDALKAIRTALATQQATQGAEPELDWEKMQALGWQRIECPVCGTLAQGAPPHTAEVEKKAARYDWLRNDASEDEQNRWLYRLPEQADEYADKRIAALQSDQAQAGKTPTNPNRTT